MVIGAAFSCKWHPNDVKRLFFTFWAKATRRAFFCVVPNGPSEFAVLLNWFIQEAGSKAYLQEF